MEVEFRGWDDRVACLNFLANLWLPILSGIPSDYLLTRILYILNPRLLEAALASEEIVGKMARGEELREGEKKAVEEALKLRPPESLKREILGKYEGIKEEFRGVKGALEEVVIRAHGEEVLREPVIVYPGFSLGGHEGSAYPGDVVVVGIDPRSHKDPLRALIHEMIHILVERDKEAKEILDRLSEERKVPYHEIHGESLTNLVMWRAGKQKRMLERSYNEGWKELRGWEKKYWKVVKEWWKEGGSLRERIKLL